MSSTFCSDTVFRLLILSLLLFTSDATSTELEQEPVPVFKSGTTLVRVDAVVADKKGLPVRDLIAEEFEVEADGKPVPVRVATFIPVLGRSSSSGGPVEGAVRRVIAFYVSIPVLRFETPTSSTPTTFQASEAARRVGKMLDDFFRLRLAPSDLVAVARADSTKVELLGDFGDDRKALEGAGVVAGRLSKDAEASAVPVYVTPPVANGPHSSKGTIDASAIVSRNARMLESVDKMISGMERLPGRRMLFLVANIRLDGPESQGDFVELRRLAKDVIEHANRAEVTFFGVNPAGMGGGLPSGLDEFASGTGGSVISGTELLADNLGKVLDQNLGYYSLGYEPQGGEKKPSQMIRVRVKRKGLKVSNRPVGFVKEQVSAR